MDELKIIPFSDWDYEQIENTFGIEAVEDHQLLVDWLSVNIDELSTEERKAIEEFRNHLRKNVMNWNEDELKFNFLGPLIYCVHYPNEPYKIFTNRTLTSVIGNIKMSGIVDFMLASGKLNPYQPYFCLHEYKREKGKDGDPLGQLLAEMLAAQAENEKPYPVYGIYIVGRNWFFVVLDQNKYSVSNEYVATKDDIFQIFSILKKLKTLIEKML